MTREIKFRAWGHASKVMLLPDEEDRFGIIRGELRTPPNTTLMQFTGLHDKNGKEIYEGDIIAPNTSRVIPWSVIYVEEWGKFTLVGKSKYAAQAQGAKNRQKIWMSIQKAPRSEVIGNIYENPELLAN